MVFEWLKEMSVSAQIGMGTMGRVAPLTLFADVSFAQSFFKSINNYHLLTTGMEGAPPCLTLQQEK